MSGKCKLFLLFTVLLSVLVAACALADEAANPIPDGYAQVAESEKFNLYLREDTLALIIESKANGSLLYSTVQHPEDFKDQDAWKEYNTLVETVFKEVPVNA